MATRPQQHSSFTLTAAGNERVQSLSELKDAQDAGGVIKTQQWVGHTGLVTAAPLSVFIPFSSDWMKLQLRSAGAAKDAQ